MEDRFALMQRIAELDAELSTSAGASSPAEKEDTLSRCAAILDRAGNDDEQVICQAIHCLIRKHALEPEHYWPDSHTTSG